MSSSRHGQGNADGGVHPDAQPWGHDKAHGYQGRGSSGKVQTQESKKERPASQKNKDAFTAFQSQRLTSARRKSSDRCKVLPQSPQDRGKLTVVLDVDETLIHSRLSGDQEALRQDEDRKADVKPLDEFTITLQDGEIVRVNKRPGLDEFLAEASKEYELMAYTAGLEEYARPLLNWLDPHGTIFRYRMYRDSCLFARGYYVKDMSKFNRPMNRIVLVDNNAFCFLPQLANGIPISSFYDDPTDTALSILLNFLGKLRDMEDVRPFLAKSFNLESLLRDHRQQILG